MKGLVCYYGVVKTCFPFFYRVAFPQIQHQRVERDDGTLEMQLLGIMRRPTPHAFPPPPKRGNLIIDPERRNCLSLL